VTISVAHDGSDLASFAVSRACRRTVTASRCVAERRTSRARSVVPDPRAGERLRDRRRNAAAGRGARLRASRDRHLLGVLVQHVERGARSVLGTVRGVRLR